MTIEVLCPNGHRLSCRDDRAGSWGKCPRCGTAVRIPSVNGQGDPEEIVFLCPNGHKLHGPANLQGLPGKCPHCQSKFRIPVLGEDEPADSVLTTPIDDSIKGSYLGRIGSLEELSSLKMASESGIGSPSSSSLLSNSATAPSRPRAESLASLFAKLWQLGGESAEVELHLYGGERIAPQVWSQQHSTSEVGLFAIRDESGGYVVHAIAWAHVQRVTLRGMEKLPGELFDELPS